MKRHPTGPLHRAVMWAARVVLVVSVVAWVLSMFRPMVALARPRWMRIRLVEGGVDIRRTGLPGDSHWIGYVGMYHSWWPKARFTKGSIADMSQLTMRTAVTGYIFVPLWIPVTASCGVLVMAHFVSRGVPTGICPSCSYDLTGIHGPCPECGQERPA